MAWGVFKKTKNSLKKVKNWLADNLPKVRKIIKTVEPFMNPEHKDAFNVIDGGFEAADDALNRQDYNKAVDWTKTNILPRLRTNGLKRH